MALPGRRLVITSPAPAYIPAVTARMTSPPIRFAPTRLAFSPSSTSAATSSSTVNPASDQAAMPARRPQLCLTNATLRPGRSGNVTDQHGPLN
jgi:hypothetical protein